FEGENLTAATNATLTLTNVTSAQIGKYQVVVTNRAGTVKSQAAFLAVIPSIIRGPLMLLTYNTHGNGVADWSTNSAQVQAIGRQMAYIRPDIIAMNEIPNTNTYQMSDFVTAYLPGYSLATNSGTDGYIRSVV